MNTQNYSDVCRQWCMSAWGIRSEHYILCHSVSADLLSQPKVWINFLHRTKELHTRSMHTIDFQVFLIQDQARISYYNSSVWESATYYKQQCLQENDGYKSCLMRIKLKVDVCHRVVYYSLHKLTGSSQPPHILVRQILNDFLYDLQRQIIQIDPTVHATSLSSTLFWH